MYPPPSPIAHAQAPPPTPVPGTHQLHASLDSSGYDHRMPLDDVLGGSRDIYMVVDLPDALELIEISSNDEEPED